MAVVTPRAFGHLREPRLHLGRRPSVLARLRRSITSQRRRAAVNVGSTLGCLGCVSAAAWQINTCVGLVGTAAALFALNWWACGDDRGGQ